MILFVSVIVGVSSSSPPPPTPSCTWTFSVGANPSCHGYDRYRCVPAKCFVSE